MANYIKIQYRTKEEDSIKKILDKNKIINITPAKFLDEKNPDTGEKNRDALFNAYSDQQKTDLGLNNSNDINEGTKIYPSATLWLSNDNVKKELITADSQFTSKKDFNAFLSENIKKIVNSDFYVKSEFTKTYPKCQVFIWCKALERFRNGESVLLEEIKGDIVNITDYIESLDTNVSETGGNFSIKLPFLPGKNSGTIQSKDASKAINIWEIDNKNIHQDYGQIVVKETFQDTQKISAVNGNTGDIISYSEGLRRENLLQNILSINDIVFIKFERLQIEDNLETQSIETIQDFYIANSNLVNQYYDMIGLIDNVSVSSNPNEVSINIAGRDLMKLLLDDGTFFFPNSFTKENDLGGVFNNLKKQSDGEAAKNVLMSNSEKVNSRMLLTGFINEFLMITEASKIGKLLESLVSTLSNIQICPDEVFSSYQNGINLDGETVDKRTKYNKKEEKIKK